MKIDYDRSCPLARAATILEGRWTLLIIRDLVRNGPMRFEDFRTSLKGVTPSMLASRLKSLEAEGLVTREFYEMNPPRARYLLTPKGTALGPVIAALKQWGKEHTTA